LAAKRQRQMSVFTATAPIKLHGNTIYSIANNGITNNVKTLGWNDLCIAATTERKPK
jgi:hypothetical protein